MTDIEEIRARHEADKKTIVWESDYGPTLIAARIDRTTLLRALDEALEELSIWQSVFPDIAPANVLPDRSKLEAELVVLRKENERLREALCIETKGSLTWWVDRAAQYAEDMGEEGFLIDRDHWERIVFAAQTEAAHAALKKTGSFTHDPFNRAVLGLPLKETGQ